MGELEFRALYAADQASAAARHYVRSGDWPDPQWVRTIEREAAAKVASRYAPAPEWPVRIEERSVHYSAPRERVTDADRAYVRGLLHAMSENAAEYKEVYDGD